MLKLSTSATLASESRRMKGTVYPPLDARSAEQAVATKDAAIRLKFIIEKLVEKCFIPSNVEENALATVGDDP